MECPSCKSEIVDLAAMCPECYAAVHADNGLARELRRQREAKRALAVPEASPAMVRRRRFVLILGRLTAAVCMMVKRS